MDILIDANRAQLPGLLLTPKCHISVEGRGTGKSFDFGFAMDRITRRMPRSITALTGQTYGQLLTRTLPSALKLMKKMGYEKEVNYVIGKKPPPYFLSSYEEINKFDNIISVSNGTRYAMISQSEKGSGRGANVDYELMDEGVTINIEQYNEEIVATNRGNNEYFGPLSPNPFPEHHGFKYSTSMPPTKGGRWILKHAEYYEKEKGINLFAIWNRVVKLQLELLDLSNPKQFADCWNEIERIKKQIEPFVSQDGVLFTIANAFDNIRMLGLSYIKNSREKLPFLIFMIEIMNYYFEKVEDCFYSINEQKQIYYDHYDNDGLRQFAKDINFDIDELSKKSSVFDRDCNTSLPLEIVPDWGSTINLFCVCQERNFDFVRGIATIGQPCFNFINEFYVKPDGTSNIMIKELCEEFSNYYKSHQNRKIIYYRDRFGDRRNPAVINSKTYNQQAISYLIKLGWEVEEKVHPGNEPPQSDKYVLWGLLLKEESPDLPLIRFNGNRCKFTLISMNNAMTKDEDGKLVKNKYSERSTSGVLPEEATHFSDAADKIVWTKYGCNIDGLNNYDFIPVRC